MNVIDIIETADFCRHCRGKGYLSSGPGDPIASYRCRYCDGTGRQTTLILEPEAET